MDIFALGNKGVPTKIHPFEGQVEYVSKFPVSINVLCYSTPMFSLIEHILMMLQSSLESTPSLFTLQLPELNQGSSPPVISISLNQGLILVAFAFFLDVMTQYLQMLKWYSWEPILAVTLPKVRLDITPRAPTLRHSPVQANIREVICPYCIH